MPRQNSVTLSCEGTMAINCNIYKENDADKRTIKNASYHDLKMAAKACDCLTCAAVLENIRVSIRLRSIPTRSEKGRNENKRARENRLHYINQLRENMASRTLKHNFTQLQKEN